MMADAEQAQAEAKARIFISYSRRDMAFADRLDAALRQRGFEPLVDRTEIYAFEDWWTRIQVLIAKSDTVIFVLSPDAVASDICAKEVAFAASLNKRFAPIVHRRVADGAVPEQLARLNFIFFDDDAHFAASVDRLAEALATDIEWIRQHTVFGEQAQRWSAAGRPGPRGLLLRSPVLEDAELWIASRPPGAPQPTESIRAFIAESRRATTRRRNILSASLGAGLVLALALAGLAYWQRGIAVQQERIAVEQRSLAEEQRGIAERNEAQALAERNRAQLTQSRFLADLAAQSIQVNDMVAASLLALEALPDIRAGSARPYVPEAEFALFSGWQALRETRILQGHTGRISTAVYSPDGRRILTASDDKTARIWDAETGGVIAVLDGSFVISDAAFSPDGRRVVTLILGELSTWDADTGKQIGEIDAYLIDPRSVAFSPDGRRLVVAIRNTAHILDAETGDTLRILEGHGAELGEEMRRALAAAGRGAEVWSAAFSPDGRRVVTTSSDKTARIWDAETGKLVAVLQGHEDAVWSAAFSADGLRVVTASADDTARIWDSSTGKELAVLRANTPHEGLRRTSFRGRAEGVLSAAFSPDGYYVVTGSTDKTVRLWLAQADYPTELIATMIGHDGNVFSVAFSPDRQHLVTASEDQTARIWNIEGEVTHAVRRIGFFARGADGRRVLGYSYHEASTWNLETAKPMAVLKWQGARQGIENAAFSPDGRRVAISSFPLDRESRDRAVGIWNAETGEVIRVLQGHTDTIATIAFSPDGRRVATASRDKTARISDAATGATIKLLVGHDDAVLQATFSPDSRRLVTASDDKTARIWDAESGASIAILLGHDKPVVSAKFRPDGRRVLTVSGEKAVRIWDAESGASIAILRGHDESVASAVFGPDGRRVLTGSRDNTARIWDAESGEVIKVLRGHDGFVYQAAFSADGRYVVTASSDTTARIWDVETGETIIVLRGHRDLVTSAMFSPDGRRVVTTSNDKTTRVWDAKTGKVIAVLAGDQTGGAVFSSNGDYLVTSSGRLWRVFATTQDLVDETKRAIPRCLTRVQREKAFLDPEPPAWCIEMDKSPYGSQDWKNWLKFKRAKADPPLPDTPEWKTWIAAHPAK